MNRISMASKLDATKMRNNFLYKQFAEAGYLLPPVAKALGKTGLKNYGRSLSVDRSLLFPPEFIYGLVDEKGRDVIPITTDVLVAATTLYRPKEIEEALSLGASRRYRSTCSFQRAAVGLDAQDKLPKFKAAFLANEPCDSNLDTFNLIFEKRGIPVYNFVMSREYDREAENYMTSQLEDFARRIAKDTKGEIRIDIDKLREAIKHSNEARKYFLKALEYMKGPGRLIEGREFANYVLFCSGGFGSRDHVEIARKFEEELRGRRKQLEGHPEEIGKKPRICLLHFPPFSYPNFMRNVDAQGDVVAAEVNSIWWDEIDYRDPFRGLARKMGGIGGVGWNNKNRTEVIHRKILEEYDLDGVIYVQHMYGTCCPLATESCVNRLEREISKANEKLGKDILLEVVPIDCICGTNVPVNIDTRIDSLFETLRQKKGLPPFRTDEYAMDFYR